MANRTADDEALYAHIKSYIEATVWQPPTGKILDDFADLALWVCKSRRTGDTPSTYLYQGQEFSINDVMDRWGNSLTWLIVSVLGQPCAYCEEYDEEDEYCTSCHGCMHCCDTDIHCLGCGNPLMVCGCPECKCICRATKRTAVNCDCMDCENLCQAMARVMNKESTECDFEMN